jgi:hypothetical protein
MLINKVAGEVLADADSAVHAARDLAAWGVAAFAASTEQHWPASWFASHDT